MKNLPVLLFLSLFASCSPFRTTREVRTAGELFKAPASDNGNDQPGADTSKLFFSVGYFKEERHQGRDKISFNFRNVSGKTIRICDPFDRERQPFTEFGLKISYKKDASHTAVILSGSDEDFPTGYKFKYIDIPPKKTYSRSVRLITLLDLNKVAVPNTDYSMEITYGNRYGRNCIKGVFKAPPLYVELMKPAGGRE